MNSYQFSDHVNILFKTTDFNSDPMAAALLHAAVGVSGEAGELLDAVKKHWAYNKPLNLENIREEIGDLSFYLQAMVNMLGLDWSEIMQQNYEKLRKRYPNGYSDMSAQLRLDKKEGE